jgi:proliferating cell nuclear antigen
MLLKLDHPMLLVDTISVISEFVNDVKIKVNSEGLSFTAIDPANVAMVGVKIPMHAFSTFEAEQDVLGINLQNLKMILRRCRAGSGLVLSREDNLLKIQIQDKIRRTFTLPLLDLDIEEKEFPSLDFSSKILLDSGNFNSTVEDCAVVADACTLAIKDNIFQISAHGLSSAHAEFSSDEVQMQAENCKSKYSLEYLQKFIKGSKFSEKTLLQFANDYPLRVDYHHQNLELSFLLAPRVETE